MLTQGDRTIFYDSVFNTVFLGVVSHCTVGKTHCQYTVQHLLPYKTSGTFILPMDIKRTPRSGEEDDTYDHMLYTFSEEKLKELMPSEDIASLMCAYEEALLPE